MYGIYLGDGAKTSGLHLLSVKLNSALREVEPGGRKLANLFSILVQQRYRISTSKLPLLDDASQLPDPSAFLSQHVLGPGGHDDDLGPGGSHTDLRGRDDYDLEERSGFKQS